MINVQKITPRNRYLDDILISLAVLILLLVYTYGLLFVAAYPGFYFNPSDGTVLEVYQSQGDKIQVGDVIERVGSTSLDEYRANKAVNIFEGIQPGQNVEIVRQRNGEDGAVDWVFPNSHRPGFTSRFFNIWWLAYIFWLGGSATQLFMRPKDTQWRLFVASNYLSGLFIMFGSVSSFRVMGSAILMQVAAWLMLPVYLHFHWIFPKSFSRIPRWLKIVFYVVFSGVALAQLFSFLPNTLYLLAVALAFGGSIVLLGLHYIFQPDHRREVRTLAIAAIVSLSLTVLIGVMGSLGILPNSSPLALVALPILPTAYFFVLYRQRMGGLELRANRALSLYVFLVILGTVLLLVVGYSANIEVTPQAFLFGAVVMSLLTVFISIQVFPAFQAFVERRLLGIKLPAENMVASFSDRIVTSTTSNGLLKLLGDDVFPSLLIRQYAFVQITNPSAKVILSRDVDLDPAAEDALVDMIDSIPRGRLIPLSEADPRSPWVRMALPLQIGDQLIGVWLLGRRDPDDLYLQAELPVLQSLANQTAIALSYLLQAERLKEMYQLNLTRQEQERQRLGHELHDSLLNEMAAMLMKHDPDALPKDFQESFDGLIVRLREIVSNLRPPMLVYGLKYALDGLADNLSARNDDSVQLLSDIQSVDDCRYPETVEHNIYRIVQEACENALKYARARSIHITGELSLSTIELHVVDDGIGFGDGISLRLDDMVAHKHYGLAGMHERAALIDALLQIQSQPNLGTHIQILWGAKDTI